MPRSRLMSSATFDIAVIGAGPAGAVAALCAAQRGFQVALVDQRSFPRDKPCGDGLGPRVTLALRELGLGDVISDDVPANSLTVHGPDGVDFTTSLASLGGSLTEGYVVPRADFDQRLRNAAIAEGAIDLAGNRLMSMELDHGTRSLLVRRHGREHRFAARLVIGADGAYSTTRRELGVERPAASRTAIAMRAYSDTSAFDPSGPMGTRMIFEWSRELLPAYGWVFPTGKGVANVGLGVTLEVLQRRGMDLREALERFAESCRHRGIELGGLRAHRSHHLPLARSVPPLAHARAALVGDAASMINPLSGEGIAYGIDAAVQLVSMLPIRLDDDAALGRALSGYERWFRQSHRRHLLSCSLAYRMMSNPWWAARVLRAAHADPIVSRDALDLMFGLGSIRARTTWRILRPRPRLRSTDAG